MRIITFADMGIGNFVWYLPVLRALAKHDLTVYCPNKQLKELLQFNIKANYEIRGKYDVSINNFICQDKRHLKEIWRIPQRIGHKAWWRDRSLIFTDTITMNQDKHEEYYNCKLLDYLAMEPEFGKIKFPEINMPYYEIIISKNSSTSAKDWEHWDSLINNLKPYYFIGVLDPKEMPLILVCAMISKAKLVIGNDSGIVKIAANLGVRAIQIFRWWTDSFVRAKIKGINLIEPTTEEVLAHV